MSPERPLLLVDIDGVLSLFAPPPTAGMPVAERPELVARLTQRHIASYIGISPEALSRIRTALAAR